VTDALPISRFPVPDLAKIPEDFRNRILAAREKSGFIPNVFLVLAHRRDEFRAFFAYHDALMERPGNLTKAERDMIVVATSSSNQCQYCVVAHGAILRIRAKNPLISVEPHGERNSHAPERRVLHHGPELIRTIATCSGLEGRVMIESVWSLAASSMSLSSGSRRCLCH
jgi:uncharacterized peroxidase-related enzyme